MGRWAQFFQLLAGENIQSNKMNLCMTMLPRLRGGHVDDLARAAFDHNEPVLAQGRALHWVSGRGAGIGTIEGMLMLKREERQSMVGSLEI